MALLGQRLPRSRIAESKATPPVSLPVGPGGQGAARLVLGPLARRTTTKRDPTLTAHQHPPGARVPETGAGRGAAPRGLRGRPDLGPLTRRTTTKRDPTLTAHQHPTGAGIPETGAGQVAAPRALRRRPDPGPLTRRTTTKRDPTLTAHQHPPGASRDAAPRARRPTKTIGPGLGPGPGRSSTRPALRCPARTSESVPSR